MALCTGCNLLWSSRYDDISACGSSLRTEVDDIISHFDNIQIVLDDNDGVSALDEGIEGSEQAADVVVVKAGCRFVENEECGHLLL